MANRLLTSEELSDGIELCIKRAMMRNDEEIIKLAIECGIGDKDLSDEESVVSDYGDITENVIEFAARLLSTAK